MPRINCPEFEDQQWFPKFLRNMLTDYLQFMYMKSGVFRPIVPLLKRAISSARTDRVLDLCSGAGGPVPFLQHCLEGEGLTINVILTDKFPNLDAFIQLRETTNGRISFVAESVDAGNVPDNLTGFRTLFTGLHHMPPDLVRSILSNAANKSQGIGIFELNERSPVAFLFNFLTPVFVMLSTPMIRPFNWQRLFFTYVVPVLPLVTMWDGFASNLRTYSLRELQKMTNEIGADRGAYTWEIGKIPSRSGRTITYLLGLPGSSSKVASASM